jgi:hypothetical protein
VFAVGVQADAA